MRNYFIFTNKYKKLYIILASIFLVCILLKIVLSCLSSMRMYIYFNRIINNQIQECLLYIIIIVLGILLSITLKNKIQKIMISIVCIIFFVAVPILGGGFWEADKSYFEFKSPNNNTIIIEESSWLLGGWSTVYKKINSIIIYRLDGNISNDNGYRPFSNNDYNLDWSIDSVKITYGFGNKNIQKSEVISLK